MSLSRLFHCVPVCYFWGCPARPLTDAPSDCGNVESRPAAELGFYHIRHLPSRNFPEVRVSSALSVAITPCGSEGNRGGAQPVRPVGINARRRLTVDALKPRRATAPAVMLRAIYLALCGISRLGRTHQRSWAFFLISLGGVLMTTQTRTGQRWTAAEDAKITDPAAAGKLAEVAAELGRSVQATRDRRHSLNKRWRDCRCHNPAHELWCTAEDSLLAAVAAMYPRRLPGRSVEPLAALFPGRTPRAIQQRISTMRKRL